MMSRTNCKASDVPEVSVGRPVRASSDVSSRRSEFVSSPRLKIRCPNCHKDGSARAELVNRRVTCKHCTHVFRVVPINDSAAAQIPPTQLLTNQTVSQTGTPSRPSNERIEALESEVRKLRDDLSAEHAEASKVRTLRDQLAQAQDAAKKAETTERTLREEVERLRDQADQTHGDVDSNSRDRLRVDELRFLRDQLDKARAEVESESRKRREATSSLTARTAEHAREFEARNLEHGRALASKEAEHAVALREAREQLDRVRTEAEKRQADGDRVLCDELGRVKAEADEAMKALDALRIERGRLATDHARALDVHRVQLAELEARLGDADATRLDRDRLAAELKAERSRLGEVDRSVLEHKGAADLLRLDLDRLEAERAAELARLREELEAAKTGRIDAEAVLLERDEALALRDRAIEALESLRAQMDESVGMSFDWSNPSTEMSVSSAIINAPTEAEIPVVRQEASTVFDGGPEQVRVEASSLLSHEEVAQAIERERARVAAIEAERLVERNRLEIEAEALRTELVQAKAEAEAASRRNLELAGRIQLLEAEPRTPASPTTEAIPAPVQAVDLVEMEAERKRAVDEAVKGAWADFERRLSETQAKLRAANERADLMELEAREAREQADARERGLDLGDGSSFEESHSMTSIRILDARGNARLTLADAEARLALAKQLAVDRKDKTLIDRISKMAEKVRADLEARNFTLAETLVRGAEIETGLDAGGFSIGGLRIFRASPTIVGSLSALAPAFDRVMRQGDLATIQSTLEEMRTILGDQAGLPEIRRVGRTPAIKRPIAPSDALRLFIGALEAENWLMRPIAAKKPLPDTSLTTYACLIEACSASRKAAEEYAPDRVALLDAVIQASCLMLLRRQQADGHFSFLDPRGRASKLASVVEVMVAERPDSVKDGWVVFVDPLGMAQAETGACAVALSTAGKALGRPQWSQAALKAAEWAMGQPCLPNFVANAASAGLLARAYLDSGLEGYLAGLARKLNCGLLPGQVDNGRWIDASSSITPNHLIILRALHDAWEAIPTGREDLRRVLKPAIDRAMSSLLAECQALGVPAQGSALRDLLRHRDLPRLEVDSRLEPAILNSATVIQELCHEGPKAKLGVAPDQLAALIRAS
jgi:hypothetical protein